MAGDELIYVVDRIVPKEGTAKEVFEFYVTRYVPLEEGRGRTLLHRWVSPPAWLKKPLRNTLFFIWTVKGPLGYWQAEAKARWDETSGDFWRDIEPMIESRDRSVMAAADDIASLANV